MPQVAQIGAFTLSVFIFPNFRTATNRISLFLFTVYFLHSLPVSVALLKSLGALKVRLFNYLFAREG